MSWLEENIGEGYQQVVIGFAVFIIGAILGWMEAADNMMSASDVYMPAVIMLSGAMVTMLGLSFGTGHEDDRTDDLMNAINELTARMNSNAGFRRRVITNHTTNRICLLRIEGKVRAKVETQLLIQ